MPTDTSTDSGAAPQRPLDVKTIAIVTAVALVVAAVAALLLAPDNDSDDARAVDGSLELFSEDHPYSPEFELPGGERGTLGVFKGQPLVVNFFGSWCAPCIQELPDLQSAFEQVGDEVTFIGLAVRDRADDAAEIIDETGVEFLWALDPELEIFTASRAVSTPTTVFFDADGEIVEVHGGIITEERVLELVAEHFT